MPRALAFSLVLSVMLSLAVVMPVCAQDDRWESVAILEVTDDESETIDILMHLLQDPSLIALAAPKLKGTALNKAMDGDAGRLADSIDGYIQVTRISGTRLVRVEAWTQDETYAQDVDEVVRAVAETAMQVLEHRSRQRLERQKPQLLAMREAAAERLAELRNTDFAVAAGQRAVAAGGETDASPGALEELVADLHRQIWLHDTEMRQIDARLVRDLPLAVAFLIEPTPPINQ